MAKKKSTKSKKGRRTAKRSGAVCSAFGFGSRISLRAIPYSSIGTSGPNLATYKGGVSHHWIVDTQAIIFAIFPKKTGPDDAEKKGGNNIRA